ncbi:MAG TPA: Calx-beta domain-containing protein, partial [Pyrinomonadaceae bacterium]|nr:Calx-beta domain-containing protein [Pyrinomonadaceae bacterium]
ININGRDVGGGVTGQMTSFCNGSFGAFPTPFTFYFPVGESIMVKANRAINSPTTQIFSSSATNADFLISSPVYNISGRILNLSSTAGVSVTKCTYSPGVACGGGGCSLFSNGDGSVGFDCGSGSYLGDYRVAASVAGATTSGSCQDGLKNFCILELAGSVFTTFTATPNLSVSNPTKQEGALGTTTNLDFTLTLGMASSQQVSVTVNTSDGTATAANNDYQPILPTQIIFAPGETTKNVTVTIKGDNTFEQDETFSLLLSNPVNVVIINSTGTGTIQNDDVAQLAPTAITLGATTVTTTTGTLNGTVNPNGVATNGFFEWGTSAQSLLNQTPLQAAGSGTVAQSVSTSLNGLTPGTTYFFRMAGTSGGGTGRGSILSFQTPVQVTVQTNPTGLGVSIDNGPTITAPQTVQWIPGSSHTISTTPTQPGPTGTQFVFSNWSDAGVLSHQVTASNSGPTFTANFTTEFFLTMAHGPGGNVSPASGFFNSGQTVQISATSSSNFLFAGWTGSGTGSFTGSTNPVMITVNGPINQTANFDPANTIQFTQTNFVGAEGSDHINVSINRSDSSGPASVDYSTSDTAGANKCETVNGSASSRCDYLITLGTLQFASGESTKILSIPIIDDVYAETPETFKLSLSNPTGATIGTPATATITINDNEASTGTNPIDSAPFYVRQQYLDFLNREPDTKGLAFWTNEITSCGADDVCIEVKRINVSAAFFLSTEFQQTGYLVERFYRVAYGSGIGTSILPAPHQLTVPIVRLNEFLADTQRLGLGVVVDEGNAWKIVLENNKQAFAAEFVQRARFTAAFPTSMSAGQFVDILNANAGNPLSIAERNQLVNDLSSGAKTRGQILRAVAEDEDLRSAESNRAFVLMQFFGYLRRNPNDPQDTDYTGYDFWLTKLNQFNGNFVQADMVKAFLTSKEYRNRFGPYP